ncbi:MAG: type II toxin-antitoxin system RelE family toxin [Spirochaetota bacterium]
MFDIRYSPTAHAMLQSIHPADHREAIVKRIRQLEHDPEKQGKALVSEMKGFRSLAVIRYRVIYTVDRGRVLVYIVAAGIRKEGDKKDIYELAKRLLRKGLLESPSESP